MTFALWIENTRKGRRTMKIYQSLAQSISAKHNANFYWPEYADDTIAKYFPHGGGFDGKTKFDHEKSTENKLVITTEFHAMDENGYYDGWYYITVTVKPSLLFDYTIDLNFHGDKDKHFLRDYIADTFHEILRQENDISICDYRRE